MNKKHLDKQFEYVRYSFYALSMSCLILVGGLEYYKVLTDRTALGIYLAIGILGWPGLRALRKIETYIFPDDESDTRTTQVLNEGITK